VIDRLRAGHGMFGAINVTVPVICSRSMRSSGRLEKPGCAPGFSWTV